MKTRIKIQTILIFLLMISINNRIFASNFHASRPSGTITVQYFYDYLSPFGRWVEIPDEGYCWIPDVPAGFVPYNTNGHWVFTDEGTAWVSYYDWGWAHFTMEGGFMTIFMDGFGYPIPNGHRLGFAGDMAEVTSDGIH